MAFENLRKEPAEILSAKRNEDGIYICNLKISGHTFTVVTKGPEEPLIITGGSTMNGLPTEDELSPANIRRIRKAFDELTETA